MNILAIGAHPDEIDVCCGGTIGSLTPFPQPQIIFEREILVDDCVIAHEIPIGLYSKALRDRNYPIFGHFTTTVEQI